MKRILPILRRLGIPDAGAVSFEGCSPLLPCRAAQRLPAEAKTVIVCIFPYLTAEDGPRNISRYAVVPDYHRAAGEILDTACGELQGLYPYSFVPFADNSPIREVSAALRAGLGVLGKNSLLIHPLYGSWVFLGTIVTDMALSYEEESIKPCTGCGACVRACPADCIGENGIDEGRCLSAVTQKKGELTAEEEKLIKKGGLLWGCDVCQQVCPLNRNVPLTPIPAFQNGRKAWLSLSDLTRAVRFRAYGFRGPGPLRRNYHLLYGSREMKD